MTILGRGTRDPTTGDCLPKSSMHSDTNNRDMKCAIEVDSEVSDKWTCSMEDNERGGGIIVTRTFPEQSESNNTNG